MEEKKIIEKFNPNKPARISSELYEFERWRLQLDVYPMRLLFMISQAVGKEMSSELFPLEFKTDQVMEYLNLTGTGRKFEILAQALQDFRSKAGLDMIVKDAKGRNVAVGMSFITDYQATEHGTLQFHLNPKARNLLVNLQQYTQVQPKYYLKLTTDYQNWFYPYLKMRAERGEWVASIQELIHALRLDELPLYKLSSANARFLQNVLGIEKPQGWAYDPRGGNKPWNYTRNKNGEYKGTLYAISKETDIIVTAYPKKEGRQYSSVVFFITYKKKAKAKEQPTVTQPMEPDLFSQLNDSTPMVVISVKEKYPEGTRFYNQQDLMKMVEQKKYKNMSEAIAAIEGEGFKYVQDDKCWHKLL